MSTPEPMARIELLALLQRDGYSTLRILPGSSELAGLYSFVYTVGLCVGLDRYGYRTRFCYHNARDAFAALMQWDGLGDPPGPWIKEKGRVERANPRQMSLAGVPIVTEPPPNERDKPPETPHGKPGRRVSRRAPQHGTERAAPGPAGVHSDRDDDPDPRGPAGRLPREG